VAYRAPKAVGKKMNSEQKQYTRLDAIITKRTERGIEENDPLAEQIEKELRNEPVRN
jgi:hypothetical protein